MRVSSRHFERALLLDAVVEQATSLNVNVEQTASNVPQQHCRADTDMRAMSLDAVVEQAF